MATPHPGRAVVAVEGDVTDELDFVVRYHVRGIDGAVHETIDITPTQLRIDAERDARIGFELAEWHTFGQLLRDHGMPDPEIRLLLNKVLGEVLALTEPAP